MSRFDEAAYRRAMKKRAEETARSLVSLVSLFAREDTAMLMALGNRLTEEAALLGGPLADKIAELGDALSISALERIKKDREQPSHSRVGA